MDITILIERNGNREYTTVPASATRIPGVHRIRWVGARPKSYTDFFSLVYVATGRACNKVPLTMEESERLIDALIEDSNSGNGVWWDRIVDYDTAIRYYANRLSPEAEKLAGRY
jgi:hypothetical protein